MARTEMDATDAATAEVGSTSPDGATEAVTAEPGVRVMVERPPPGLARGSVPVPAWVVVSLGVTLAAVGVTAFCWRALARHRTSRGGRRRSTGVT